MTSNAGSGDVEADVGFGAAMQGKTHSVLDKLGNYFKPEFLNRFDDIVEFHALTKDNLMQIVDLMIADVNKMLATQGLHVNVTKPVEERLVELGYDPKMGARPLRRVIQEQIEDRIADFYLDHPSEKQLIARIKDDKIEVAPDDKK